MTAKERLKIRLPDAADERLEALLADATDTILAYTGRTQLPDVLQGALVQLAVIAYNREGTEGETSHSEGGVSRGMQGMPDEITAQLKPYRLAKVVDLHATAGT